MAQLAQTQALLIADFADNSAGLILAEYSRNLVLSSMGVVLSRAPGVTDDAVDTAGTGNFFDAGNKWIDNSTNRSYVCISGATGAAIWQAQMFDGETAGGDLSGSFPDPEVTALRFGSTQVPLASSAGTNGQVLTKGVSSAGWSSIINQFLPYYLAGFQTSPNGPPTQSIQVKAGCCADATNAVYLSTSTSFYKSLASAWAGGTGSTGSPTGGLDTGSVAASTWYHFYAIAGAAVSPDFIFSTSGPSVGPSLPSGYTYARRVWSVLTNGAKNIIAYSQYGNKCVWLSPIVDINTSSQGTTQVLYTLNAPLSFAVEVSISGYAVKTGGNPAVCFSTPGTIQDLSSTYQGIMGNSDVVSFDAFWGKVSVTTNNVSQIQALSNITGVSIVAGVQDYIDPRGQDGIG